MSADRILDRGFEPQIRMAVDIVGTQRENVSSVPPGPIPCGNWPASVGQLAMNFFHANVNSGSKVRSISTHCLVLREGGETGQFYEPPEWRG